MHIGVATAGGGFDEQTRAYAEFRMFSALARFGADVGDATVTLTRAASPRGPVACAVTVGFTHGARLRVSARGPHAYDAINRAVSRLGDLLRDETPVALTS